MGGQQNTAPTLIHGSLLWEMVRDGEPGVLQSMGLQRVGHDWATEQQLCNPFIDVLYCLMRD